MSFGLRHLFHTETSRTLGKIIKQKDSLVGTNKNSQIQSLLKLGLTKKEIRELKLEKDRVNI